MNKPHLKIYVTKDALQRMAKIGERLGDVSPNALASALFNEFSHVRPEVFYEALGSIPADLKARSVGRPAGSKTALKSDQTEPDRAA